MKEEWIEIKHKMKKPNTIVAVCWCTQKENANFPEALANKQGKKRSHETCKRISDSHKGLTPWNKGLKGTDYSSHFKNGFRKKHNSVQVG